MRAPFHILLGYRSGHALAALACGLGLLFALYLEHFRGLEPCPMCVFQRVAMFAAGLSFLLAALHEPGPIGRGVYAVLGTLASGAGAFIAGRHVWLQSLPEDQVPACGPTLDYLLDFLPVQEVIRLVLSGDGNCARIDAAWLGISLPGWTLISFIGLGLYALLLWLRARSAPALP
jgi:protein dithiol:quinone oxidoreductase